MFKAIFQDREGKLWVSRESKNLRDWFPYHSEEGFVGPLSQVRPWDNSEMQLVGLQK